MSSLPDPRPADAPDPPPAVVVDIAAAPEAAPQILRTPENDAIYRGIRGEISAELTLVTARVNWLIASQAFLLMPLTIATNGPSLADSLLFPLVPVLGLLICLLILVSILAAVWRSRQWRRKARQGAYRGETGKDEFSIVLPDTPAIPLMGFVGGIGVPVLLAATWIAILIWPPTAG